MATTKQTNNADAHCDCVIIGGGPAGLALAVALNKVGRSVTVLEKQTQADLCDPPFDGRDIAITHGSEKVLADLGVWQRIAKKDIHPAKGARVLDGTSPFSLSFNHGDVGKDVLGNFVSNHVIRKAAYEVASKAKNITILNGIDVRRVDTDTTQGSVHTVDGRVFTGDLVVAADGRFSPARRMMGIGTDMRDFGRVIVVGRMRHEKPHRGLAYECFHYGRTLAVLPLEDKISSVVVTLPAGENGHIMAQTPEDFARDIETAFSHRLGKMTLVSERFSYPLVAIHAATFTACRFALLGDAAVGMHPVTAHGYNLGLRCVSILQAEIARATALGLSCGDTTVLDAYNRQARLATWPLYQGTNFLVGLFNDTRPLAKLARKVLLRTGQSIPPLKRFVTSYLAE